MIVRGQRQLNTQHSIFVDAGEQYVEGLGFLPIIAAAPAIGPAIWAGISAIGGAIASLFGFGGDDQATDYRAPANASEQFVTFNDQYGNERVAYDMGPETQRITAANGNRWDDVNSYYSAFISNSTRAGASSAARRVIEDVARQRGVSISRAADLVLQAAGAVRLVQQFLPSGQSSQSGQTPTLPGYCPVGTYHPYPIGHPQQDICIPFPGTDTLTQSGQSQRKPATTFPGMSLDPRCPQGQVFDPQLNKCVAAPECPQGLQFNAQTGRCEAQTQAAMWGIPWWVWLLLAAAGVAVLSRDDDRPTYRRSRR